MVMTPHQGIYNASNETPQMVCYIKDVTIRRDWALWIKKNNIKLLPIGSFLCPHQQNCVNTVKVYSAALQET